MQNVEFYEVQVLRAAGTVVICRVGRLEVSVPSLLLQPGGTVQLPGDRGRLVIPRWLAIGLGLVWPFPPTDDARMATGEGLAPGDVGAAGESGNRAIAPRPRG